MSPVIEKLVDGFAVAEGPHWDVKSQSLFFVGVLQTIHKYVPSTKKHTQASLGNHIVSLIIPVKGKKNEFIISLDRSLVLINWDGESNKVTIIKKLYEVDQGTTHIFNDGKCDKTGRIWSGTMPRPPSTAQEEFIDKQGTLYSFENNTVKIHNSEIGMSNGIAFDYNKNKMYYIDSLRGSLDQYDIDFKTGTLTNMKKVFTKEKHGIQEGHVLDGMTIDSDGNLWVAVFGDGRVYQIDPNVPEMVLQYVEFPAKQITSVAFGGPNLDELYVTSANHPGRPPVGESPGAVFRVKGLNVTGLPPDEAVV